VYLRDAAGFTRLPQGPLNIIALIDAAGHIMHTGTGSPPADAKTLARIGHQTFWSKTLARIQVVTRAGSEACDRDNPMRQGRPTCQRRSALSTRARMAARNTRK